VGEGAKKPVREQKGQDIDVVEPFQELELLLALIGLRSVNRDQSPADMRRYLCEGDCRSPRQHSAGSPKGGVAARAVLPDAPDFGGHDRRERAGQGPRAGASFGGEDPLQVRVAGFSMTCLALQEQPKL